MLDDILLGNYKTVSERLGLTIEGGVTQGHLRICGVVEGVALQMWFGMHATHTSAQLTAPAPIDLSIVTTSLFGKLAGFFTKSDHAALGDPGFDKTFSVKASDVPRLSALLDADARQLLLRLAEEGLHPAVDRHTVHLRRFSNGGVDGEETILRDFQETARAARTLGASFARGE